MDSPMKSQLEMCQSRDPSCPSCIRAKELLVYYGVLPDMDAPLPATLCEEWGKFLAKDSNRPVGLDLYDDVFDHPLLFQLQRRREMAKMMNLARSIAPKVVCEVGADKGGSFYHWIKALPSVETAYAIEIRGVPYAQALHEIKEHPNIIGFGNSSRDPKVLSSIAPKSLDIVFLDGDKSHFVEDFDAYLPLVRKGGMIMLHDIYPVEGNDPTVKAWETIKKRGYKTSEIIDFSEVDEEMERAVRGEPPRTSHAGWVRTWQKRSCSVGVVFL